MKAYLIMDGQWGSCGKGLLAGKLALDRNPDLVVCNFGPNAGHTFITPDQERLVTRQLPTGLVADGALLLLGPGAIIDPAVLADEFDRLSGQYQIDRRLMIHERAAVVLPQDRETEARLVAIASTRKGVGAALARKILRESSREVPAIARDYFTSDLAEYVVDAKQYRELLFGANLVQIESAQGFELSLNHGSHYPYCTSRDVTPEAILNDAGVPHRCLEETAVVVRTYPIRVGNELDANGQVLGTSGPVYPDMQELSWQTLSRRAGQPLEERTTVTGKIRRVFTWSDQQFLRMLESVAPASILLNFANYLEPDALAYELLSTRGKTFVRHVAELAARQGAKLTWLGFGPGYADVEAYGDATSLRSAA